MLQVGSPIESDNGGAHGFRRGKALQFLFGRQSGNGIIDLQFKIMARIGDDKIEAMRGHGGREEGQASGDVREMIARQRGVQMGQGRRPGALRLFRAEIGENANTNFGLFRRAARRRCPEGQNRGKSQDHANASNHAGAIVSVQGYLHP